jgi:hypothetical protein
MHFMGQPSDTFKFSLPDGLSAATLGGEWCMAYANERSHRLDAIAHTALPSSIAPSPEAPRDVSHVVVYEKMQTVEQVIVPEKWSFYEWTEAAGALGQPIGAGTSSNARFVRPDDSTFAQPADGRSRDGQPPATQAEDS